MIHNIFMSLYCICMALNILQSITILWLNKKIKELKK